MVEDIAVTKLDPRPSVARAPGIRVHPCLLNRMAGVASLLLALAACAGPAAPPDVFWRIEPAAAERLAKPLLPGVLEVQRLTADGVLDERAITFAAREGGALSHYKYDLWSEPPGLMLQDRLSRYLTQAGTAERVLTPDLGVLADWTLRGKIRRLEFLADTSKVVVEMELSVVSARNGTLLLLERYEAVRPAGSSGVEGMVTAMDKATSEIFARFLADLTKASAGKPTP